ncbi:hypothetical protein LSAT2_027216 [Lamellibrachia satsuma]|nr:hypothetical protein LSAT2_027216 [Lamellibrachia satsuma]
MDLIDQVVLNYKVLNTGQENCNRMEAATFQSTIQLWSVMVSNDGSIVTREIGHDPVAGIKSAEMGLGRSRMDTYVLSWTAVDNYSHIQHNYHIPDGVAVWMKTRVSNNVSVDMTPP